MSVVIIPSLFKIKSEGDVVIASVHPSVMLSPTKTNGRNSTIFGVPVTHMNSARNGKCFWPGALERGQKVKYHLISITKSISKIFIPNFVYVLTNERYKTYRTNFYSFSWFMA